MLWRLYNLHSIKVEKNMPISKSSPIISSLGTADVYCCRD